MNAIIDSPFFGIIISILVYRSCQLIQEKLKIPLANPLILTICFIILLLKLFHIPLEYYNIGGDIISMMLPPATAVLALSIYNQRIILKEKFLPIVVGCLAGALTAMGSAIVLCKLFGLDQTITNALIPKSVTTPIAIAISEQLGGIVPITIAAVIITGLIGCIGAPLFIKVFHISDPVAQGVAIGTSSHALGTTKAVELGEIQGAMSGIAIGITGIITVILALLL